MKGEIDHITSKVETLEMNQETAHTVSKWTIRKNIARGTTDPGYWVRDLNNVFNLTSVRNLIQVTDSIPWVRCASGNVYIDYQEETYIYILIAGWGAGRQASWQNVCLRIRNCTLMPNLLTIIFSAPLSSDSLFHLEGHVFTEPAIRDC